MQLTPLDTFRLKFRSETYAYDWFRGAWIRTWPLGPLACLLADFPMSRSYKTGHIKPSVEVSR